MRLFYFFLIIISPTVVKSQNLKCVDFKTGTFKILDTNIYRTQTLQKEGEQEATIEWKSECVYELTFIKSTHPELIGKKCIVKIEKIKKYTAFCNSTFDALPGQEFKFEMVKIINK